MLRQLVTFTLAVTLSTTAGCATTRGGKTGAIVIGAGLMVAGGLAYDEADDIGAGMLSSIVFALGLGTTLAGLASHVPGDPRLDVEPPPPPPVHRELPEAATDAQTLQLAHQARDAAIRGDCDSVRVTMAAIAARDPRYHLALARSLVIDGCL